MELKFRFPISDSELIKFLLSKVVSQYASKFIFKRKSVANLLSSCWKI